jgi:hypothetical protein
MRLIFFARLTVLMLAGGAIGCAPPANQAQPAPANSGGPPAPPAPSGPAEIASGAGNSALPPSPPRESPQEPPPLTGLPALSPLAAYENLEKRINATLRSITDGASANAAAPELNGLTAELKLKLRPYLASIAAMSDAEQDAYLQRKTQEAISQKSSGNEVDHSMLIDLARQPGNEPFKAALVAMFQTMNDEGSTGIRRTATRMLEKLNAP